MKDRKGQKQWLDKQESLPKQKTDSLEVTGTGQQKESDHREADMKDLLENEELLRITLQSIGDAVMATDDAGQVVQMNPVAETMTGWPLAEARGKPLSEIFNIINAKTRKPADDPVAHVLATGNVVGLANHTMLIARDGREYQIMDSAAPIRDDRGKTRGVVLVFSDVTDQYAAEEALRLSEERWQFALESSGDGVWDRNLETGELFFSPRWKAILGYEDHEIGNSLKEWLERIHPDDRQGCMDALDHHFRGRSPLYTHEYRLRRKDGDYVWILARGKVIARDEGGNPLRFIGTHADITDRKRTEYEREQALREAREQARRQKRHMEMLSDLLVDLWIHESDTISGLVTFTETAAEILAVELAGVWFFNEDHSELVCRNLYDSRRNWHGSGARLLLPAGSEYRDILALGLVLSVSDISDDPRTMQIPQEYFSSGGIVSLIHVPVRLRGDLAAILSFEQVGSKRDWLPEEEQMALTLGAYLSNYLEGSARRQAEDKYRSIFENALEGIFQSTPEGRFISANPAFARMAGYESPEDLLASVSDIEADLYLNAHDRLRYREILTEKGFVAGFEAPLRKRDGSVFWVNLNTRVVRNDQGDILFYEGTAEDITDRKKAEEERKKAVHALGASEENFRRSLDESPLGVRIVSDQGETLYANRKMLALFGYDSLEEWLSVTGPKHYTSETYERYEERKKERKRSGIKNRDSVEEYEIDIVTKDGQVRHILTWRNRILWNGKEHYQIIYRDITERKRAEAGRDEALRALRESEEKYRLVVENANDVIWTFNLASETYDYVSPSVEWVYGVSSEDALKRGVADIHPPESLRQISRAFKKLGQGELPDDRLVMEAEHYTATGQTMWMEISATVLRDDLGRVTGFVGVNRDITERKQTETELTRYREFIENVEDACFETDLSANILFYNEPFLKLSGFTAEEHQARSHRDRHPTREESRRVYKIYRDVYQTRIPAQAVEYQIARKDGSVGIVEVSISLILDASGNPVGFRGIGRDITDRKRVETEREEALRALSESEEKYRLVVENATDVIWTYDLATMSYGYLSPSVERVYGYPVEIARRHTLEDSYPPVSRERLRKAFRDLRYGRFTGDRLTIEVEHFVAGGNTIWMELSASAIKDDQGQVIGFAGVSRDINDRKLAELERERVLEALRESEERYRDIFHSSPDAVTLTRLSDGVHFDVNDQFLRITGYSRDEVVGVSNRDLETWYDPQERKAYLAELKDKGYLNNMEAQFRMKDGRVTTGLISSSLLLINGEPYIQAIVKDITDIKEMEEQSRDLERRLVRAQKLESIGTLAGGIAHDFNNLLMGIQGYTSLMLLDLDSSHAFYARLKHIEEQVASGAGLTNQLLGFARGGRYEVKAASINDIIDKTAAMFGRTKKEVAIHKRFESDLWNVEVDRTQMEQVFMNLYVNAWQAMVGGGELYLETENVFLDQDRVQPFDLEPGLYVKISVTDTGMGMDAETRERIFDPFFSTKAMGRGTGLGLATVYGIVRGHRGIINVYSESGRGTTFTLYLPASEKAALVEQVEAQQDHSSRATETILLVDDEAMVLDVSRELLESLGYTVHIAGSGQEAVAIYVEKKNEIDLVILDMIMPGISGSGTFDQLREINPDVKVILSSGYSLNGEARHIMDRGCDSFLQKPFHLHQLSRKIRSLLDD